MSPIVSSKSAQLATPQSLKKAQQIFALEAAQKIAARIKDPSAMEAALIGKLEAERDFAGEYRGNFPHGDKTRVARTGHSAEDWCLSHGFAWRTVRRWCELLEADRFAEKKRQVLKRCWQLAELWQAANFLSESVEWFTPGQYIQAVRAVLGEIDLDPASNLDANRVIKADKFFSKIDNGLGKVWKGRFFLNPPYGRDDNGQSLAAEFCKKAIAEYEAGNSEAGIVLVNSLHSQAWQAPLYRFPICFVNHRIQFVSGDGEENKNPTFQNIFVYLGRQIELFSNAFGNFGYVMVPYGHAV